MLSRVRLSMGGLLVAAAVVVGPVASAATVDLQFDRFSRRNLAAAQDAQADFLADHAISSLRAEGFEGFKAWNGKRGKANPQNTAVGSFTATGRHGSGHSVVSTGKKSQVRKDIDMRWGRYDAEAGDGTRKWLDSNDNTGIKWQIGGVGKFNVLSFFVTDAADVGGKFSIKVGDTLYSNLAGAGGTLKNGNIHFVRILLDEAVENLTVVLKHNRSNDGFGIDGVTVGRLAPVPLPPAAALLLGGIATLAGLRRRRRA